MSKYRKIKTEFKELDLLIKAMDDIRLEYEVHEEPVSLEGFQGRKRKERAHIVIPRRFVNREISKGFSNDIGLLRDDVTGNYELILSSYDQTVTNVTDTMSLLRQRYAYHNVVSKAKRRGYNIEESTVDGQIRIKLARA